ncbi:MAG: hypothetical protein HYZ52_07110 [Candidatus Omnitrophica bacterium]|nr:hypothetical protein [Candidatus Omnitrophota bacterium]
MTEPTEPKPKAPGMVIFTAVLNFLTAAFFFFWFLVSLFVLVFRNAMGVYDFIAREYPRVMNLSFGLTFLFGIVFVAGLFFFLFFLAVGIGLLRGEKIAWYFQVALSLMGLLGFPIGTALNGAILIFFFQPPVRNYFKV